MRAAAGTRGPRIKLRDKPDICHHALNARSWLKADLFIRNILRLPGFSRLAAIPD